METSHDPDPAGPRWRLQRAGACRFPGPVEEPGGVADEGPELLAAGTVLLKHRLPRESFGGLDKPRRRAYFSAARSPAIWPAVGHRPEDRSAGSPWSGWPCRRNRGRCRGRWCRFCRRPPPPRSIDPAICDTETRRGRARKSAGCPRPLRPAPISVSISSSNFKGSITTPLAITEVHSGRRMPEGIRWKAYFFSPTLTEWPALEPPFQRMAKSKCSVSRSTIFPLPSSPHCRPTMEVLPSDAASGRTESETAAGMKNFPEQ